MTIRDDEAFDHEHACDPIFRLELAILAATKGTHNTFDMSETINFYPSSQASVS